MKGTIHDGALHALCGIGNWLGGAVKALAVTVAIALAGAAQAETWSDGTYTWTYRLVDDTVEIYKSATEAAMDPKPTSDSDAVVIPSAINGRPVTRIGDGAFYECKYLGYHDVVVPDTVKSFGNNVFYGCTLLDVFLPKWFAGVVDERSSIFENHLGTLTVRFHETVNGVDWKYSVADGEAKIDGGGFPAISTATVGDIAVPATLGGCPVTSIGDGAFYQCGLLTGVMIPATMTSIGRAFLDCSSLKSVEIPSGVPAIEPYTFYNCSALESVTIPDTVSSIGDNAFSGCSSLNKVYVGYGESSSVMTKLTASGYTGGATAVEGSEILVEEVDGIKWRYRTIGGKAELFNEGFPVIPLDTAGDIEIPATLGGCPVTSIGGMALANCNKLTGVTIPPTVTSIGAQAFSYCTSLYMDEDDIPATVTSIGDSAFYKCEAMADSDGFVIVRGVLHYYAGSDTDVKVPYEVTRIGREAFYFCSTMKKVTIPSSVKVIGSRAFVSCTELSDLVFAGGLSYIGDEAFLSCSKLPKVSLPPSVLDIGPRAFEYCSALTEAYIPKSVTSIGTSTFYGSALATVHVESGDWTRVKQLIKDSGFNVGSLVPYQDLDVNFTVTLDPKGGTVTPTSVTVASGKMVGSLPTPTLEDRTFLGWFTADDEPVTSTTMPADDMTIYAAWLDEGYGKWIDAKGLDWIFRINAGEAEIYNDDDSAIPVDTAGAIEVPATLGGCPVTRIGNYALWRCAALTEVTIPATVKSIGDKAFYECNALATVLMPELGSLESIGEDAFSGCVSIRNLNLPNGLKTIGNYAFEDCTSLQSVSIPDSVTAIGRSAFDYCISMETAYIGKGVTTIGQAAFRDCESLVLVSMQEGLKSVGYYSFAGCEALTSVTIPEGVTEIYEYAFLNCSALARVTLPSTLKSIKDYTFCNCDSLATLTIPGGVEGIGVHVFERCKSLTDLTIPGNVKMIGASSFFECTALASVTMEYGVESIGDDAFNGCTALTTVTIPKSVETVGDHAFGDGKTLKTVNVSVGDKARVKKLLDDSFHDTSGINFVEQEYETWTDTSGVKWTYHIVNGEAEIYNDGNPAIPYKSVGGDITVPATLGGCPVTSIGDKAFYKCALLTDVEIPESVTNVGAYAFWGCDAMADADEFVIVRDVLYYYAGSDAEVTIPGSVSKVGTGAFSKNATLKSVIVSDGVKSIAMNAFRDCAALASVTVPKSVTKIGKNAFSGTALATVYVGRGDTDRVKGLFEHSDYDVSDVTFVEPPFKVRFDANGGTCKETTRDVAAGKAIGKLPVATLDGWILVGWFTEKEAGDQISEATIVTADAIYYAHWTKAGGDVDPDAGKWYTTKAEAMAAALKTGKKVFLVCGRDTCYNTMTTKNESCEEPSVKAALTAKCVLWYSNCDTQRDENGCYWPMGVSVTLPLVCVIDPKDPDNFIKRTTGGDHGGPLSGTDVLALIADIPYPTGGDPSASDPGSGTGTGSDSGTGTNPSGGNGFVFLYPGDIKDAYSAGKTLYGAVYSGQDVVGVVELKLGKLNVRRKTSKVSGYVTLLDGKKYTIKGVQAIVGASAPLTVALEVKKVGAMAVTIGGDLFAGSLGSWHVQTAVVGGNWKSSEVTASVDAANLSMIPGTVLETLLPYAEKGTSSGIKWTFPKAANVRWAKPKAGEVHFLLDAASGKGLIVDTTKGRTNLSAMKLNYMAKKGTFKGSFKVFALESAGAGKKLKKYNVKVNGVVVNGVGYGSATCKRPVITWSLMVR